MENLIYWLWLTNCKGLSDRSRRCLLRHFGAPEAIWHADAAEYGAVPGLEAGQAALLSDKSTAEAERILERCEKLGARVMTCRDDDYPERLRGINLAPLLLYIRGSLGKIDEECAVGVVGTRACTPYGLRCADKLSYELARQGALIVSGAARGIDSAAHLAALRAGRPTVAVLGCGLDVVYPRENKALYADIAASGALVSEYPPGAMTQRWFFAARNRIISALSLATLVVEADEQSGALITARTALEQGREVFAVPGPIDAPKSRGCNRLIAEGAGLCTGSWDVLRAFQPRFPEKLHRSPDGEPAVAPKVQKNAPKAAKSAPAAKVLRLSAESGLTDDQIRVLRVLRQTDGRLSDELIEATGIPTRRVLSALTILEIDGVIAQDEGRRFHLLVACSE